MPARIIRVPENSKHVRWAHSSSHAEQSGSTSNAGPPNSQAGHDPSTSSNTALAGYPSNYAESNSGSHDSWDDMDCGDQYLENYEDRKGSKEKSRLVIQAEEQAKQEKERARTWSRWATERREKAEGSSRNRV